MLDLIQQIVEVLQSSNIVEERGNDVPSKFWATYKKVSSEYDDNMLERCNGNMDILLIFAGLFSAVNTTFIIASQPNPVDTTNTLLVQLTLVTLYGSSAPQPLILSPSTGYSSDFWTQALAYASLAFSLLAAFGAVMGKQWLGYYKTNRYGRSGSLEDRCKQRHRKFQKLESWQLENVLQAFTVLIQMSLFLFAMSLGAAMWTQQPVISILLITTTVLGALGHFFTILLSLISTDSPFQTPFSIVIQTIIRRFSANASSNSPNQNEESTESAMWWILDTSTNPDVLMTAFELMITLLSKRTVVSSLLLKLCAKVLDMLKECFGITTLENNALVYGKALIHLYLNYPEARDALRESTRKWDHWQSWRDLYLRSALAQCKISHCLMLKPDNTDLLRSHYQANTRTALSHMVVAAGIRGFNDPDDESLLRDGQYRSELNMLDVDWLMDCVEHFCDAKDFEPARHALLLFGVAVKKLSFSGQSRFASILNKGRTDHKLRICALSVAFHALDHKDHSSYDDSFSQAVLTTICPHTTLRRDNYDFTSVMRFLEFTEWFGDSDLASCKLQHIQLLALLFLPTPKPTDNPARHTRYCRALIRFMDPRQTRGVRHTTALHKACNARLQYLPVSLHSELSAALLALSRPVGIQGSDTAQNFYYYVRLIFTLARSSDWRFHLEKDGHIRRCIEIIPEVIPGSYNGHDTPRPYLFYLAGILPTFPPQSSSLIKPQQWWNLMRMAWHVVGDSHQDGHSHSSYVSNFLGDDGDIDVEIIETLATETAKHMKNASIEDLKFLHDWLRKAVDKLESRKLEARNSSVISAVKGLRSVVSQKLETT
ncbi:hypothetical protein AZE42_03366 [Rhizopogon vesiculosus]|uniref:DUF6535 domain-containing protein n=1 Tax=Rhizopogon vesiculosus TaxID=180088 RepID=A0A1J8Q6M5_9AGAM|nr:hypothetical protein AZE42_03366 [Rhizopogon vesiculosus]